MYRIAILSSTRGTNLQSFIEAKNKGELKNVEISCVISDRLECGAVDKAMAAGIPTYAIDPAGKTRAEFDGEVMKLLEKHQVDLVVLGGYMRIIGPEMVRKYDHKIINIHPSLLPKYPGMDLDVHAEVIRHKEKESGMTIHYVDEQVDHGEIILQKKVAVDQSDTPETLKAKVQELEKKWYPKVVEEWAEKNSQ